MSPLLPVNKSKVIKEIPRGYYKQSSEKARVPVALIARVTCFNENPISSKGAAIGGGGGDKLLGLRSVLLLPAPGESCPKGADPALTGVVKGLPHRVVNGGGIGNNWK